MDRPNRRRQKREKAGAPREGPGRLARAHACRAGRPDPPVHVYSGNLSAWGGGEGNAPAGRPAAWWVDRRGGPPPRIGQAEAAGAPPSPRPPQKTLSHRRRPHSLCLSLLLPIPTSFFDPAVGECVTAGACDGVPGSEGEHPWGREVERGEGWGGGRRLCFFARAPCLLLVRLFPSLTHTLSLLFLHTPGTWDCGHCAYFTWDSVLGKREGGRERERERERVGRLRTTAPHPPPPPLTSLRFFISTTPPPIFTGHCVQVAGCNGK